MAETLITIDDNPRDEDVGELVRSLVAYNNDASKVEEHRKLAGFVRDDGRLVGGVSGYTHWQWLFVGHLWVAETHRNTGLGSRLLRSIEQAAVARGCRQAWLDTFSFQAPDFYRRHGYTEFAILPDYPLGFSRHFLWKPLNPK